MSGARPAESGSAVWAGMSNHTEGDFDEKGLYILFWATEHIQGQRMFGLHYMIEMFGLQAWPEVSALLQNKEKYSA